MFIKFVLTIKYKTYNAHWKNKFWILDNNLIFQLTVVKMPNTSGEPVRIFDRKFVSSIPYQEQCTDNVVV